MKQWGGNLGLLAASVLTTLLAFEGALRIIGFSYPSFFLSEDVTGAMHRSNVEGWYREEGEAYIKINSAGLRDREHSKEKPANTVRIAVLGDSYAEALQVPLERTFWHLLETGLNDCSAFGDKGVEIINFGVSGYSTAQELLTLEHRVWPYSPDIILLAFLSGNDVRDNSKAIVGNAPRPFFVYRNGRLELDSSFVSTSSYRLRTSWVWKMIQEASDHSRLLQMINKLVWLLRQNSGAPKSSISQVQEPGLDDHVYLEPTTPEWREAWNITEDLISTMNKETSEKGARFIVVTLTNGAQVNPNLDFRRQFMEKRGIKDLFYPDKRIAALGIREGIEVVPLALEFEEYAEKNQVFLHGFKNGIMGDGHWNENGHALAAKIITEYLCSHKRPIEP